MLFRGWLIFCNGKSGPKNQCKRFVTVSQLGHHRSQRRPGEW